MPETVEDGTQSGALATVIILCLFNALSYADRQIITLSVAPIKADLGISDFALGLIQGSAFVLLYATLGVFFGAILDRGSRRWLVWAGVSFWSLSTMLCGAAKSTIHLFMARVGVGAGEAILAPAAYSLISDLVPAKRLSSAIGIFHIGSILGAAGALIIGGQSIGAAERLATQLEPTFGHISGWQIVFLIVGLPGLIIAPLAFLMKDVRRSRSSQVATTSVMPFLARRRAYLTTHFLGFGCIVLLASASQSWVPTALIRIYGMDVASTGVTLGIILVIGGIAGYLIAGLIGDRMWAKGKTDSAFRYARSATLILLLCCPLAFISDNVIVFLFGYGIQVVFVNQFGIAAAHLQITTPPALRGRISALFLMCAYMIGMMLGPPSVGLITDVVFQDEEKVGFSIALVYLFVCPLAILLFSLGRKYATIAVEDERILSLNS